MSPLPNSERPAQQRASYDVLIAGAGPVGLLLACELALAGCAVLVLEKAASSHSPLKQFPFGVRGLNAPSVEALDRRGLLPGLKLHQRLQVPHATAPGQQPQLGGHFAGIQFQLAAVDTAQWPYRLPNSPAPSLMTELAELEAALTSRALALGVRIEYGQAITGFAQSEAAVTVQASDHTFQAGWLVGCDGGRSLVRKMGGFDFVGTEPEFTGYTLQAALADPAQLRPGRNLTATGMYLQSQPGYLIVQDYDGGAFHQTGQPLTLGHAQAVLRRISGTDVTLTALHTATTWTDRARQASTYRRGRVLLAGDAAHIHSPLGGQGLNLGLGDALNLGWKLAATIGGHAPADLLDTYSAERHPVGAQVLDWSRAQVALMKPDPAARALHAIVRDFMETRDGTTYVAGRVWGVHTRYDLGNAHPLVGRSAPNFELADGSTANELLRTGRGLLLDFEGSPALEALATTYGSQLRYVAGPAKEQLGLRAVLLRPDGVVAWVSSQPSVAADAAQAAARWFSRPLVLA